MFSCVSVCVLGAGVHGVKENIKRQRARPGDGDAGRVLDGERQREGHCKDSAEERRGKRGK